MDPLQEKGQGIEKVSSSGGQSVSGISITGKEHLVSTAKWVMLSGSALLITSLRSRPRACLTHFRTKRPWSSKNQDILGLLVQLESLWGLMQ